MLSQAPERDDFQILLFSKIVPNLKKLGLLDAADGWLREKFTEMGVIAFEDLRRLDRGRRRLRRRLAGRAPGGLSTDRSPKPPAGRSARAGGALVGSLARMSPPGSVP